MNGSAADGNFVALHRSRFVEWCPAPIVAAASTQDGTVVAIARGSGDIELWDVHLWHCFLVLPGSSNSHISSLAWVTSENSGSCRLFSGDLDGQLVEWDLYSRRPKHVALSLGGAIWALAVKPHTEGDEDSQIAVACDDGVLRLFAVQHGILGAHYSRSFPHVPGRLLCIAWHKSGQLVLAGTSAGAIHVWQAVASQEALCIRPGSPKDVDMQVWSVCILADGTVVSGDSTGKLSLWSGEFGTQLQSFELSDADILAVAASGDGKLVFASGIDERIFAYQAMEDEAGSGSTWVPLGYKRPHTHDVRTMLVVTPPNSTPVLLTGSNDARLYSCSVNRFLKVHPQCVCSCPQVPGLHVAAETAGTSVPRLLSVSGSHLDVWQLGRSRTLSSHDAEGSSIELEEMPVHLIRMEKKGEDKVLCADISATGTLVAFSDTNRVRLLALEPSSSGGCASPGVRAVKRRLPGDVPPAQQLKFRPNSTHLLVLSLAGDLAIVDTAGLKVVTTIKAEATPPLLKNRTAASETLPRSRSLAVSIDGRWAAVAVDRQIHIVSLETDAMHQALQPTEESDDTVSTMAFSAAGDVLVVATVKNYVLCFDVHHGGPLPMGGMEAVWKRQAMGMTGRIIGIAPSPAKVKSVVLYSSHSLCHVELEKAFPEEPKGPRRKAIGQKRKEYGEVGQNWRVWQMDQACLLFAHVSNGSAVLVERSWEEVLRTCLPEPHFRHRFGT